MNRKDENLAMQVAARREAARLRAENEKLRAALAPFVREAAKFDPDVHARDESLHAYPRVSLNVGHLLDALNALNP